MDENTSGRRRKRYKTFLDPTVYQEHSVCKRTAAKWSSMHNESGEQTDSDEDFSCEPLQTTVAPEEGHNNRSLPSSSDLIDDEETIDVNIGQPILQPAQIPNPDDTDYEDAYVSDSSSSNSKEPEYEQHSSITGSSTITDVQNLDAPGKFTSQRYIKKQDSDQFDNNTIIFEQSSLTVRDVMTMIVGFSLRFSLSEQGRTSLTDLIKICAGPQFQNIDLSSYRLSQIFDAPDSKVVYNFYCTKCFKKILHSTTKKALSKKQVVCEECETEYNLNFSSNNYFLSVDIAYQVQQVLEEKNVFLALTKKKDRIGDESSGVIRDIVDGRLYKDIPQNNVVNRTLTYNFNTDGAPIFNNSSKSCWPLQLVLNDLPPELRFRYLILAGILVVNSEPTADLMNLYLSTFVEQAKQLSSVTLKCSRDGESCSFNLTALCACVDSVARPILQNRYQFNAHQGCSWCYQKGESESGSIRYGLENHDSQIRTHDTHMRDMNQIMSRKPPAKGGRAARAARDVRGVKGFSVLTLIATLDMVWGFPIDYLHAILLGITRQIWKLWVKLGANGGLTASDIQLINSRLANIRPTQEVHRLPRPLQTSKIKWKASEWKFWLLCYSLPCLAGILNDEALKLYALVVKSVNVLLKSQITESELNQCELDILKFVGMFQIMYGKREMTFNMHSLLHLVQSVRASGPLWATSTFPYENNMYYLKKFVNGPKGIEQQIVRKSLQVLAYKTQISSMCTSLLVEQYCTGIFSHKRLTTFYEQIDCGTDTCTFIGKSDTSKYPDSTDSHVYQKCIYAGRVYHSVAYTRAKKTNDTIIELKSGKIVQILEILNRNAICYLRVSEITTARDRLFSSAEHILKILSISADPIIVPITDVSSKIVLVKLPTEFYICKLPNDVQEIQ